MLNLGTLDNVRRSKEEYIEAEMLEKTNNNKKNSSNSNRWNLRVYPSILFTASQPHLPMSVLCRNKTSGETICLTEAPLRLS